MNTVNIAGAIASIVGLIASAVSLVITFKVFSRVKTIQKSFCTQAMLPTYRKKLRGAIRTLGEHQKNKNGSQIRIVMSRSQVTLNDLAEHLGGKRAELVNHAITSIKRLLDYQSDDVLWKESGAVIGCLQGVQETVANLENEMQWRVRDA